MSATPEFVAEVATGFPAVPLPGYDQTVCIFGTAYAGTYEPRPWGSSADIASEYTSGPAARDGRHLVTRTGLGLLIQRVESTTPGSYNELDDSAFTGTASPSVVEATVPRDEGELYIRFASGTDEIGTAGATYYASDDDGRLGADTLYKLGTSSQITFADINAAIVLNPPEAELVALANDLKSSFNAHIIFLDYEAELVALANDIKAQYQAHRVLTAGGVHGAADSTNTVSASNATDIASAITLLNELRTDYEAHRVLIAGTVHGAADSTNAITAAVATNGYTAVLLAIDLAAKYEAHRVLTAGGVHGAADSTNVITESDPDYVHGLADSTNTVVTADATDLASCITLLNVIRTKYEAHRVFTSGSVHGAADSTNTISAPAATTGQTARTLANELQTKFNAHIALTAGGVHNQADTTNDSTEDVVSPGSINAGDIIRVSTNAPAWGNTELGEAFTALANSDHEPSMILISGRILPANLPTITTGLDALEAAGKRCLVVTQARKVADGETAADWRANLDDEWDGVLDYRVAVCAGDGLATFTNGSKTLQYARGFSTQAMARLMSIERYRTAWEVELGRLEDFTISDANGIVIGHDEATSPGLKAAKFWTVYRAKSSLIGRYAFLNFDVTRWDPVDRVRSVRVNRITNRMIIEIQAVGLSVLGKTYDVKRISPTSGTLSQAAIDALIPKFAKPIINGFQNDISDWNASDLITIGQTVTIDTDTDAFELAVTVNYTPKLPVGRVTATFAVRLGV